MALPAIVVVLVAGLWGLRAGSLLAQCTSAARAAALAGARGESDVEIANQVARAVGPAARVVLSRTGSTVTARVSAVQPRMGPMPSWQTGATAVAVLEPGGSSP